MSGLSPNAVTFALTSCGRFDLLLRTLETFFRYNTHPISRFIIIEDSGDEAVRQICGKFDPAIEIIVNPSRLGLLASLDRLYREIKTDLVFHCEDDWVFFRSGFVEESIQLLNENPSMSMVSCRGIGPNYTHNRNFEAAIKRSSGKLNYRFPPPASNAYAGYSFNPGLRRLAAVKRLGRFADFAGELEVSEWFVRQKQFIGYLEKAACETTAFRNSTGGYVKRGAWLTLRMALRSGKQRALFKMREMLRSMRLLK